MGHELSFEKFWDTASPGEYFFRLDQISAFPDSARLYLEHAIVLRTRLATSVRLRMHGEIKLQRWLPFKAEQVIRWDRGMIWCASVSLSGIPIRGFDRIMDGIGAMRWKLFGIIPVMTASGPDISRSAAGRLGAELLWLPSVLCREGVSWTALDSLHPHAGLTVQGHRVELDLAVDDRGRLKTVHLQRWGNPDGAQFREVDFGGIVEEEASFGGYTIPSRLRIGWYFGTSRFDTDGEFFRVTVDDAIYR